ncbi:MAG: DUF899 family protein [Gammaproteobacteria bacterium]
MNNIQFPNESDQYRKARNELLQKEIELRKTIEKVSTLRRTLPQGGKLKNNYLFEEGATSLTDLETVKQTCFSELFEENKRSLVIYSFMYGPNMAEPCPACTSILDGLNGSAPHISERVNFVVVAKSPIQRVRKWAKTRCWTNLRLLSSSQNTYNSDYHAETESQEQIPALNVFIKSESSIVHSYNTELLYMPTEDNQDPRHVDSLWPLWNIFDLTPNGRGKDWYPKLEY